MVDKITAQRDVEYFYELLAKETDENKRAILQRLLAEAEKRRQTDDQEDNRSRHKANADHALRSAVRFKEFRLQRSYPSSVTAELCRPAY